MAVCCHLTCGFVGFRWTNGRSWVMATWNTSSYWRMPHIHPGIRSCSWDLPRKNILGSGKRLWKGAFTVTGGIFQPQRSSQITSISTYIMYIDNITLYIHSCCRDTYIYTYIYLFTLCLKYKQVENTYNSVLPNILEQLSSQLLQEIFEIVYSFDVFVHMDLHEMRHTLSCIHDILKPGALGGDMVMALQSTLPDVPHTCWGKIGSNITPFLSPFFRFRF